MRAQNYRIGARQQREAVVPSTDHVTKGAERLLVDLGFAPLREVSLTNGRRVDLIGLNKGGKIAVVEVKSGLADFCSDKKWQQYLPYCQTFYFAVDKAFPLERLQAAESLPEITGIIIADAYGGEILRPASERKVNAARAKTLVHKMARTGAMRLLEKAGRQTDYPQ